MFVIQRLYYGDWYTYPSLCATRQDAERFLREVAEAARRSVLLFRVVRRRQPTEEARHAG